MWNADEKVRERKVALAGGGYAQTEKEERKGKEKLSRSMAMIVGILLTIEIMIAGAMIFNIDFLTVDGIALVLAFVVLYFGVVAVLTDK